jgi:hypothetical protein
MRSEPRAVCWRLRQGESEQATCLLSSSGSDWELRVEVNGTLQWSARFCDQVKLLLAARSWQERLRSRGWS